MRPRRRLIAFRQQKLAELLVDVTVGCARLVPFDGELPLDRQRVVVAPERTIHARNCPARCSHFLRAAP